MIKWSQEGKCKLGFHGLVTRGVGIEVKHMSRSAVVYIYIIVVLQQEMYVLIVQRVDAGSSMVRACRVHASEAKKGP